MTLRNWRSMMTWERTAKSWIDFLKYVKEAECHLASLCENADPEKREFWYRGHEKRIYKLIPRLFRYRHGEKKEEKLYRLYTQMPLDEPGQKGSAWETLFDMQHYGIPTRLLDWTEVLGIAVYFAVTPDLDQPCVYILDPLRLNKRSRDGSIITSYCNSSFDYQELYWRGEPVRPSLPIAISPTYQNTRLERQRGQFTIHGSDTRPLEEQCPECLCRVILGNEACSQAREFLRIANLNAFSIFPDFVGMAQFVKNEAELEPIPYDEEIKSRIKQRLKEVLNEDRQILENPSLKNVCFTDLHVKGISACNIGENFVRRRDKENELVQWLKSGNKPYLFVSGEAGIGKTNFLLWLVLYNDVFKEIPVVFFSLNLYDPKESEKKGKRLEKFLFDYILAEGCADYEKFLVRELIAEGEILLILDGLDELARIKSQDAVQKIVRELNEFVGGSSKAKVIISCRNHILNRLKSTTLLGTEESIKNVEIGKLERKEVKEKIEGLLSNLGLEGAEISRMSKGLVNLAQVPLFYDLIRQSAGDLKNLLPEEINRSKLYKLWFEIILKKHDFAYPVAEMEKIGQVAGEMLEKRSDLISLEDLRVELKQVVVQLCGRPFGIFVEEFKDTFAFSHQSLREFILAWSVYKEIKEMVFNVLSGTPSFDYEGAETYRYLADLINLKCDLVDKIDDILGQQFLDRHNWNNLARNLFETLGMLVPPDKKLIEPIIRKALEILRSTSYNGIYVCFRTKYNIVRCLERLHPSAPRPYVEHILGYDWRKAETGRDSIPAYAIRGFHRKMPGPGIFPRIIFEKGVHPREVLAMASDVSESLLDIMNDLSAEELPEGAEYLRINCTYALIRWLPDDFAQGPLENKLLDLPNPCRRMKINIFWSLYRRFGLDIPKRFRGLFTEIRDIPKASNEARKAFERLISTDSEG
jgi:hypothetical protein